MPILIKEDLEILQVTQPERPLLSNQTCTAQTQQQGASRPAPRNIDNRHYGSMAFTTLQQTKSILKQPKTVRFSANQPLSRAENKSIQPTKAVSCLFCRQTSHRALQCPMSPKDRVDAILKEKRCTLCYGKGIGPGTAKPSHAENVNTDITPFCARKTYPAHKVGKNRMRMKRLLTGRRF